MRFISHMNGCLPVGSDCLADGSSKICNPNVSGLPSGLVT